MQIPFLDLRRERLEIGEAVDAAAARVHARGQYILGPEVEAFEDEWARFCEVRAAAGVATGTDALSLALVASGAVRPGRGDQVITSSLTAGYTGVAILNAGGVPVFADIDPRTYTLAPPSAEAAITPRTRAIVPVHLHGGMADMPAINDIAERRGLVVIEDAAQAHGARLHGRRAGSWGHAAAFSFYPTKNLGAYGDGGAVVSTDLALIARVKALRQGGHLASMQDDTVGRNSRLDELHAAVLRVKLTHLDAWNERRRLLADAYSSSLRDAHVTRPSSLAGCDHVHHLYVVRHAERDRLRAHLAARDIETAIHYPFLLHQQPLLRREDQAPLPAAEAAAAAILSLPLYPQLRQAEGEAVVAAIQEFDRRT